MGTKIVHNLYFTEEKRANRKFWIVENYTIKMSFTGAEFNYENLFNGNEELSTRIHKLLNENWKEVGEEVIAGTEKAYGAILKSIANSVFNKVSMDDIFPK